MKKHLHRLGHARLLTGNLGALLPVGCVETLPGDVMRLASSVFIRMSPLAAPVMHEVDVRLHHFYVPNRIVWEEAGGTGSWEDFITGGNAGTDTQTVPTLNSTGTSKDLLDYLGIPPVSGIAVNALPIAGFNRVFNEWYRDQDLVTERTWNDLTIPQVAWEKDYFTSARPWPQRGAAISLPLGTSAPVSGIGFNPAQAASVTGTFNDAAEGQDASYPSYLSGATAGAVNFRATGTGSGSDRDPDIYADLSTATAATIRDLRVAFALQRFAELRAQLGARYPEYLARYGVRDADGRIQVPELIGGGSSKVDFSEVLQTALDGTGGRGYEVGDLYGHGVAGLRAPAARWRCPEWGFVLSMLSVRPRTMYMDGIHRSFLRQDREDFFMPELQQVGEQPVYNNEVYADVTSGDDTFGYQGRYDEYRSCPSGVSGEFRSLLDYWHLGRTFASAPALNSTFVTCSPPKRIFNEQTQDSMWIRVRHSINAVRPVLPRATTRTL